MPRPVCVKCQREMTIERPVVVQLNAKATKGPYQQWHGDLAQCEGCGASVVTGFAPQYSWAHFLKTGYETPDIVVEERPVV